MYRVIYYNFRHTFLPYSSPGLELGQMSAANKEINKTEAWP